MEPAEGPGPGGGHAHPHGLSKLTAGTRKLAARLGIKKDKERGSGSPRQSTSPAGGSPRQLPGSPATTAASSPGGGWVTVAPPSPLGTPLPDAAPRGAPLTPATPAVAAVAPQLVAASPLEAGLAAPASPSPLHQGMASAHLPPEAGRPESPGRQSRTDLESARERLARLRSAAERAAHVGVPIGGAPVPGHHRPGRLTARAEQEAEPPGAAAPREAPTAAGAAPSAEAPLRQQQEQARRHVEAAPYAPGGPTSTTPAPHPPAPAAAGEPASPPAPAATPPAAAREAAAAEMREEEGLALFKPASDESRRGRLATAVAMASPYLAPPQTGAPSPAEQAAAAAQPFAAPPDGWEAAAERPVAAVGGTTGLTHVGGRADLTAAHLRARPAAAAEEEAAEPGRPASGTAAAEEAPAAEAEERERPLSPTDVQQGRALAAADVAAGPKAAADTAAAAAPAAASRGGAEPEPEPEPEAEAEAEPPLSRREEQRPSGAAIASPLAEAGQQEPAQQVEARGSGSGGREEYIMGPAHQERQPAGPQPAPSEPLLPAGAFNQDQDISVYSPRDPIAYEKRDSVVSKALEVLPPGPAATLEAQTEEEVELAQFAAGASPERLEMGPFGAQVDSSVFTPEGRVEPGPGVPVALDRRTESEAVVVEELAEQMQAAGGAGQVGESAASGEPSTPAPRHGRYPAGSEGPEPPASPGEPLAASEAETPGRAGGREERQVVLPSDAELQEALESAVVPGQQPEEEGSQAAAATEGEAAEVERRKVEAAEVPFTPVVAAAAEAAVSKAAEAGAAAKETTAAGVEKAAQAATAAKEAATGAAAGAAEKVASAAAAARVTAERVGQAVSSAAAAAVEKTSGAAQAAKDATATTAAAAADKAAAAKDAAVEGTAGAAEVTKDTALEAASGAAEAAEAPLAGMGTEEASREGVESGAAEAVPEIQPEPEGGAEQAEEADKHGGGMASSLLGVAASAVHAVQEQLHNMLEHGRQLAAEQDAGAADVAAGGGSLAGGSVEGEREEEREGEGEGEVQERFGEGGRRSPVLPVPPAPQQPTMKEAVEQEPAVSTSLLQTLEGAEEPSVSASAPAEAGKSPEPPARSPGPSRVLPVAVTEAGKPAAAEAARQSLAVDASLAAEQEVPEVGAAEVAGDELAGAELAQPESLDATAEYLEQREAARGVQGLQGQAEAEGEERREGGRMQLKDLSGLEAVTSPRAAAAGGVVEEGGEALEEFVEDLGHYGHKKDEPLQHTEAARPSDEAAAAEAQAPAAPEVPAGEARQGSTQEPLASQYSIGGLREPPPSPTVSTSPVSGGAGDFGAAATPGGQAPEAGTSAAGGGGPGKVASRGPSRLQTSTTFGSSVAGEDVPPVGDVGLRATAPADRMALLFQSAVEWVRMHPVLAAGAAVAIPLVWMALNRAATAALGDFGPVLLLSGAIAAAATAIAWLVRWAGVPESELDMIQQQAAAAAQLPGTGAAADTAGAGAKEEEAAALMEPSEPVSAESIEDFQEAGGGGHRGLLQAARETVEEATEGALAAVQPGGEQVGEVVQETESGGEEAAGEDPVASALHAVAGVARAAVHGVESLADKAYHVLSKEAPGADIGGQGAPLKGIAEGEGETRAEGSGVREMAPAPPDQAPHPPPPPTSRRGQEAVNETGYESDSEGPGPVLEGVHPAHHPPARQRRGGRDASAAVVAREQAATSHRHAQEDAAVEAEGGEGQAVEPTIGGEAHPGLLTRAAEAGGQMASRAAGSVKHAAAKATGTAEEQQAPGERLEELQRSIAQMERERAGDVEFQRASKELGM